MLTLQELADRAEITDIINNYGKGVASRDIELLVSLFTDDAVLDYYGRELIKGVDGIRALFDGSLAASEPETRPIPLDEHVVSTPIMTNVLIELDGDRASADSYCLATHAGTRADEGLVLVRGTRNRDQLRRTPDGWKISTRLHEKLWSIEVPGVSGVPHRT